jgi:predicted DNA-binding ribbon-helix-helix protein
VFDGRKTSVCLENEFWDGLQEIARLEDLKTSALVKRIADSRKSDISHLQSACSFSIISEREWLGSPLASQNKVEEGRGPHRTQFEGCPGFVPISFDWLFEVRAPFRSELLFHFGRAVNFAAFSHAIQ